MDLIHRSLESLNSASNESVDNNFVVDAYCMSASSTEGRTQKKIIQGVLNNYATKVDPNNMRFEHKNFPRMHTDIGPSPPSTNVLPSPNNTSRTAGFYSTKQWSPNLSPTPVGFRNPGTTK